MSDMSDNPVPTRKAVSAFTLLAGEWFIGLSMAVLALLKLQNIESFASMFLN